MCQNYANCETIISFFHSSYGQQELSQIQAHFKGLSIWFLLFKQISLESTLAQRNKDKFIRNWHLFFFILFDFFLSFPCFI